MNRIGDSVGAFGPPHEVPRPVFADDPHTKEWLLRGPIVTDYPYGTIEWPAYKTLPFAPVDERKERADEPCKTYDAGKPPLSWLPREALEAMARVLDQATGGKYERHNWLKGMSWSRHLDSAMRHLLAYNGGEDLDPESGQSHLAHAMVRLAFVLTYQARGLGTDDRYKP